MFSGNNGQKSKNKHQQKSSYSTQQGLSMKEIDERVKKISMRLSRENICRQHKLISNMNLKLQATLRELMKFDQLKQLSIDDVMRILQRVSYLEAVSQATTENSSITTNNNRTTFHIYIYRRIIIYYKQQLQQNIQAIVNVKTSISRKVRAQNVMLILMIQRSVSGDPLNLLYKLKYHHSQRTIILAGINRAWTESAIKEFNTTSSETANQRCSSYKKHPNNNYQHLTCQISGMNEFWIAVQADTAQNAQFFKKFIRMRKKSYQSKKDFSFKQDKRRVRIVMQNQDFYTLLVDAMTQKKYYFFLYINFRNSQFIKRLVNPNSGLFPTMCSRDMRRMSAFDNQQYQLNLKKANKILYFPIIVHRQQLKQSDDHFTLDEVYSEDRSRASQLFESSSNMDDLVQKADQGTQAQSLGVGTQDDEVETQQIQMKNIISNNDDEITSEMVSMNNRNKVHEEKSWQSFEMGLEGENVVDDEVVVQDGGEEMKEGRNGDIQNERKLVGDSQAEQDGDDGIVVVEVNNIVPDSSLQKANQTITTPLTLHDLKQPQIPSKFLTFYFSTHTQTQSFSLNYTKMKRLQQQYIKKSASRMKLTPGIPQDFRQISEQQRNRDLFFFNIFKSMEKSSQKKEWISEFY